MSSAAATNSTNCRETCVEIIGFSDQISEERCSTGQDTDIVIKFLPVSCFRTLKHPCHTSAVQAVIRAINRLKPKLNTTSSAAAHVRSVSDASRSTLDAHCHNKVVAASNRPTGSANILALELMVTARRASAPYDVGAQRDCGAHDDFMSANLDHLASALRARSSLRFMLSTKLGARYSRSNSALYTWLCRGKRYVFICIALSVWWSDGCVLNEQVIAMAECMCSL